MHYHIQPVEWFKLKEAWFPVLNSIGIEACSGYCKCSRGLRTMYCLLKLAEGPCSWWRLHLQRMDKKIFKLWAFWATVVEWWKIIMHWKIQGTIYLLRNQIKGEEGKGKKQQVPEYLKTLRPQTAINKPRKSVITAERNHIYNLLSKPINLN